MERRERVCMSGWKGGKESGCEQELAWVVVGEKGGGGDEEEGRKEARRCVCTIESICVEERGDKGKSVKRRKGWRDDRNKCQQKKWNRREMCCIE